jgi:hypothetical protein
MERTAPNKLLCGRRVCANGFNGLKAYRKLGRYYPSADHIADERNPLKAGTFSPLKTDRPWHQVAGPAVDLRLATVGADDAVKHADKVNRGHWREAGRATRIQNHHAPVNIVGGYRSPDAPQRELTTGTDLNSDWSPPLAPTNGDPLDIPDFLARTQPEPTAAHDQSENAHVSNPNQLGGALLARHQPTKKTTED